MELRLIHVLLPWETKDSVRAALEGAEKVAVWHEPALDGQRLVRVLAEAEDVEPILDRLESRFGHVEGFRAIILRVEASLPRPRKAEPVPAEDRKPPAPRKRRHMRVSREELLSDLMPGMKISTRYLALVVLSAIVAAFGLMRDNVAVIIGAMVIAPLLTPNMALALATTLGDLDLTRKAVRTNAAGVGLALIFSFALGLALSVEPTSEMLSRTEFSTIDAVVALAAGAAGVLAFTAGVPAGLVGVMVAVALMPPLVTAGLLTGSGHFTAAGQALLLLATNVICVNLAAVVTFLLQGVRPRSWWEADKAKRATRRAVVIWAALLAVLIVLSIVRGSI